MEFETKLDRAREVKKRLHAGELPKAIAIDLNCSVHLVYSVKHKRIFKGYL